MRALRLQLRRLRAKQISANILHLVLSIRRVNNGTQTHTLKIGFQLLLLTTNMHLFTETEIQKQQCEKRMDVFRVF